MSPIDGTFSQCEWWCMHQVAMTRTLWESWQWRVAPCQWLNDSAERHWASCWSMLLVDLSAWCRNPSDSPMHRCRCQMVCCGSVMCMTDLVPWELSFARMLFAWLVSIQTSQALRLSWECQFCLWVVLEYVLNVATYLDSSWPCQWTHAVASHF